ncbi:hypothetical protein JX265_011555 [Neoarthrinium moseri]|uniref:Infection structure specific protein n=1 Tax=Neoarthrinium moseri TaxID=1658444 RepID=A0A9P9WCG8_9PEZI|nr:uncharacterized protein JN550_011695 [Neoarthrinium moseri]KAI1848591.1 hypothetical protein JX266_005450 [Neoarthrinium moseri]KAI1856596.1 hypothetical protein JX265_011555 [Neoarthrinium moseri]KAI1860011.1 hypothetical protein JN550_011695 [Neoarthrinium moseri]
MRLFTLVISTTSVWNAYAQGIAPTPVAPRDLNSCSTEANKFTSKWATTTAPASLVSAFGAASIDACAMPTITGTNSVEASHWYSSVQSEYISEFRNVYSVCNDVSGFTQVLNAVFSAVATGPACSSIYAQVTSGISTKNVAPRETGLPLAAAALAAGFAVAAF